MCLRRSMMILAAVHRVSCTPSCRAAFVTRLAKMRSLQPSIAFTLRPNEFNESGSGTFPNRIYSSSLLLSNSPQGSNEKNENNGEKAEATVEPTWTYTPYQPPPPGGRDAGVRNRIRINGQEPRRYFSTDIWIVPKTINIPEDKLEMSFERSSGAGGQNVNKVNTKVIIKMNVMDSTWIPYEVRQRIIQNEANKINKEGFLIINSQEYRTQVQNRKDALDKLQELILKNYPRPKERKIRTGISKKAKEINKEQKRFKSEVKKNRKRVDFS